MHLLEAFKATKVIHKEEDNADLGGVAAGSKEGTQRTDHFWDLKLKDKGYSGWAEEENFGGGWYQSRFGVY